MYYYANIFSCFLRQWFCNDFKKIIVLRFLPANHNLIPLGGGWALVYTLLLAFMTQTTIFSHLNTITINCISWLIDFQRETRIKRFNKWSELPSLLWKILPISVTQWKLLKLRSGWRTTISGNLCSV